MRKPVLWYAHDPMCGYCYLFRTEWQKLRNKLVDKVEIRYVLGGLAPDTDEPMPKKMLNYLTEVWRKIHEQYGVEFNFDFFEKNMPRRSTYMSCRAVIVAQLFNLEKEMIEGIQNIYYRHAKNPADVPVLVEVAVNLGLDGNSFERYLLSDDIEVALQDNIKQAVSLNMTSFPSLLLEKNGSLRSIAINYQSYEPMELMIYSLID